MRYALWSHGRLLGHTNLDLDCHQDGFIHGFLDETLEGRQILPDATGVAAVCARRPRAAIGGEFDHAYLDEFERAVERREALDLELRDEAGAAFEHDFIRVSDLFDTAYDRGRDENGDDQSDCDDEDVELDADLLAEIDELRRSFGESERYGSAWPPPDPRWETTQYYLQVYLKRPDHAQRPGWL